MREFSVKVWGRCQLIDTVRKRFRISFREDKSVASVANSKREHGMVGRQQRSPGAKSLVERHRQAPRIGPVARDQYSVVLAHRREHLGMALGPRKMDVRFNLLGCCQL